MGWNQGIPRFPPSHPPDPWSSFRIPNNDAIKIFFFTNPVMVIHPLPVWVSVGKLERKPIFFNIKGFQKLGMIKGE